jgi:hypothetical protein
MSDDELHPDIQDDGSLPTEQPTVDAANATTHARQKTRAVIEHEQVRAWWSNALRHPVGGKIIWGLLQDAHTFETKMACGPNGFPQSEATWYALGEQMFGQRLYRTLVLHDREALFALHDKFDSQFVKPKPARKKRDTES